MCGYISYPLSLIQTKNMVKTLVLTRLTIPTKFVISGHTQLGRTNRSMKHIWAVPGRPRPELFQNLEALIHIEGDLSVSRNHAGIYQENERFYILDMNSLNGTYVNDESINPRQNNPQARELYDGDVIKVALTGPKFGLRYSESDDHALLVAAGEDYPGAMNNGIRVLQKHLRRRGYICHTLIGEEATKKALRAKLEEIKYLTVPGSNFFMAYHGHGGPNGICLIDQFMNPRELYKKISPIRGRKALILDTCNAGLFVDERNRRKIPADTLVLASSAPYRNAGETLVAAEGYVPRFTHALVSYLEYHPEEFNLKKFYRELHTNNRANIELQGPMLEGINYNLPKELTVLSTRVMRVSLPKTRNT